MSHKTTKKTTKKKAAKGRAERIKKRDFVAQQIKKGRTKAQAEATYKLVRITREVSRTFRRQKRWRRRLFRRHSPKQRKAAASLRSRMNSVMRRPYKPPRKDLVEKALRDHFYRLGVCKFHRIIWIDGPSDLPHVTFNQTYRSQWLRNPEFRARGIDSGDDAIWLASLFGQGEETADPDPDLFFTRRHRGVTRRMRRRRRARRAHWRAKSDRAPFIKDVRPIFPALYAETKGPLKPLSRAASAGLFAFWPTSTRHIVALARPLTAFVDGRLHNADGPAIVWPNGQTAYSWRGISVIAEAICNPSMLSIEIIDKVTNSELRRVLIERYGPERYLRDGHAVLLHEDDTGRLWGRAMWNDEALVMVEVQNSTPEPDGSVKTYWLRVPSSITTAHEAIAWTFRMDGQQYDPQMES